MEKKGIDYETTALRCPFCNCEPAIYGFADVSKRILREEEQSPSKEVLRNTANELRQIASDYSQIPIITAHQFDVTEFTNGENINIPIYVSIHCPGCGVDMKGLRRDSEEEGETIKRLIKKWNLRNITLGVNINKLIDDVNRKSVAVSRLLGQQIEVSGYLFKFSNPIVNKSFTPQERHAEILNGIKDLQRQISFWRLAAAIFMAMTTIAIFLLK